MPGTEHRRGIGDITDRTTRRRALMVLLPTKTGNKQSRGFALSADMVRHHGHRRATGRGAEPGHPHAITLTPTAVDPRFCRIEDIAPFHPYALTCIVPTAVPVAC